MRRPTLPPPLRSRPFRLFLTGRTLSYLGSAIAPVALAFAVLDVSDSPVALGIVLAAHSIPMAAFMLIGGVVSDRFSRSAVLTVANLGSGLSQAFAAWLLISGPEEIWSLALVQLLNGTVVAFTFPALQSAVPQLVGRDDLQQSNAMLSFTHHGAAVVGPSAGAVLVVTAGSGWALAVDAATYLACAAVMSRLRLPAPDRTDGGGTVLAELREGWGEFVSRRWVWVVVAAFAVLNMIETGIVYTLGPSVARDTIGEGAWGLVLTASAAGFLVMTVVLMKVRLSRPLRAGMIGMAGMGVMMLALGVAPHVVVLVVAAFVGGMGMEVFGIGWTTALQEHVPGPVLSRVVSYDGFGSFVAIPVGQLLAGPMALLLGRTTFIVAGALVYLLVVLATLAVREVRDLPGGRTLVPTGAASPAGAAAPAGP